MYLIDLSIEGGELTPTLKVSRPKVNDKYKQLIDLIPFYNYPLFLPSNQACSLRMPLKNTYINLHTSGEALQRWLSFYFAPHSNLLSFHELRLPDSTPGYMRAGTLQSWPLPN